MNEETKKKIKELNLPLVFENILEGKAPSEIDIECSSPRTFYYLLENHPSTRNDIYNSLIPLWETNGDSVTGYLENQKKYIRYYFEDSPGDHETIGETYNELITQLILNFMDAGWEDDELHEISKVMEFKHLDYMLEKVDQNIDLEGKEWEEFTNNLKKEMKKKG